MDESRDDTPVSGSIADRVAVLEIQRQEDRRRLREGAVTFARMRSAVVGLGLSVVGGVLLAAVGYGRLQERVEVLRELATEVRADLRDLRRDLRVATPAP